MPKLIYELLMDTNVLPDSLMSALDKCEVIYAQNVAEYVHEQDKEPLDLATNWEFDEFPNLAPPFEAMFIEYKSPIEYFDIRYGFLIISQDKRNGEYVGVPDHGFFGNQYFPRDEIIERSRWFCTYALYVVIDNAFKIIDETQIDRDQYEFCIWDLYLDDQGNVLASNIRLPINDAQEAEIISHEVKRVLKVPLLSISLMHCKNVELIERGPGTQIDKVRRRNKPKYRYHILEIEPMKKVLISEGQSEKTGLKKALHICRGHFKDYRERGLFGKFHDIYWWDSHVRGSIEEGIVDKDYSVKAPKDD